VFDQLRAILIDVVNEFFVGFIAVFRQTKAFKCGYSCSNESRPPHWRAATIKIMDSRDLFHQRM
jgi:hypothetical protein